jgi:hypothetical protein
MVPVLVSNPSNSVSRHLNATASITAGSTTTTALIQKPRSHSGQTYASKHLRKMHRPKSQNVSPNPRSSRQLVSSLVRISLMHHMYLWNLIARASQRHLSITSLEKKFSPERLRQHTFEWRISNSKKLSDEWLPNYHYPSSSEISIEDVWNEHLTAEWGARWRRNDPAAKLKPPVARS